jgi:hypothetical protein
MNPMSHDASSAASPTPHRAGTQSLRALAGETLRFNDAGSYTFPDRDQYPHQWAWDSAFSALGWAHIDSRRGYSELTTLMAAQGAGAMVPHIAYDPRSSAKAYRPEPDAWGVLHGPDGRAVSAITQPPVAAMALRYLYEHAPALDTARELVARIFGWHRFLLTVRDPEGRGEPILIHPWESGRDNSVEWDEPLQRIEPSDYGARADTAHVDETQRPTGTEYGRYQALIDHGRETGWNQDALVQNGPFRAIDTGFSVILAAACHDLSIVADAVGSYDIARASDADAKSITRSLLRRADDDGIAWSVDLVTGTDQHVLTAGTALLALLPDAPPAVIRRIAGLVLDGELASPYGVRSLDRSHQQLEPQRYWRGPVWANITWLCALGLDRNGRPDEANELRMRMLRAVGEGGMREYFDPDTGEGLGSRAFSWTAAVVLATTEN